MSFRESSEYEEKKKAEDVVVHFCNPSTQKAKQEN
jgi:hypothetical protein